MCCLGFYAKACGLKDEEILDVDYPTQVADWHPQTNRLQQNIVCVNDDSCMGDSTRESELISIFAVLGIVIRFVD